MQLNRAVDERRILARVAFRGRAAVIVRQDESGGRRICKSTRWRWNIEFRVEIGDAPMDLALLSIDLKPKP